MQRYTISVGLLSLCLTIFLFNGCSTVSTVNNATYGSPKFFSGTRVNINAIIGDKYAIKKFSVKTPKYPILDLPGSFLLDFIIFPLTLGAVIYEATFRW